jgi:hypothetical protein
MEIVFCASMTASSSTNAMSCCCLSRSELGSKADEWVRNGTHAVSCMPGGTDGTQERFRAVRLGRWTHIRVGAREREPADPTQERPLHGVLRGSALLPAHACILRPGIGCPPVGSSGALS